MFAIDGAGHSQQGEQPDVLANRVRLSRALSVAEASRRFHTSRVSGMSGDLESLEETAEQNAFAVNLRTKHGNLSWALSSNIEHAAIPRKTTNAASIAPIAVVAEPPTGSTIEITTYTELIESVRQRVGELGIRYVDFDKLAGFAEGLTGKAFGPSHVKRLGIEKVFDALRAASLKLRVEHDPE
jgi:hypothetical protein